MGQQPIIISIVSIYLLMCLFNFNDKQISNWILEILELQLRCIIKGNVE